MIFFWFPWVLWPLWQVLAKLPPGYPRSETASGRAALRPAPQPLAGHMVLVHS